LATVADREAAQVSAFQSRYRLECEIAALVEEHIKPLKTEISTLMGRLSDQLGIPRKYLNASYKPYALKRDAEDFEDEDEQAEVLDQITAVFTTLQRHGMVDLVAIAEGKPQPEAKPKRNRKAKGAATAPADDGAGNPAEAPVPVEDGESADDSDDSRDPATDPAFITARAAGENAARGGDSIYENPYEPESGEAKAFTIGYWRAKGALAHDAGAGMSDNPSTEGTPAWSFWRDGWNARSAKESADAGEEADGEDEGGETLLVFPGGRDASAEELEERDNELMGGTAASAAE
jgi:hypothetical protein